MRRIRSTRMRLFLAITLLVSVFSLIVGFAMQNEKKPQVIGKTPVVRLPGDSFSGELPKSTAEQTELAKSLRQSVEKLATEIGERNLREFENLKVTAVWLDEELIKSGYEVERQSYLVKRVECQNLIVERKGKSSPEEIVLIGAHYDSVTGSPGANDNGSGTAALLEFAKRFSKFDPDRTLRIVFFVNEEPPHFQSETMGSWVYARRCKERKENITAVLSLETIGYYSEKEGSQRYPFPLGAVFPKTGNFVGFVANVDSGPLVERVLNSFRKHAKFPSEATSLPDQIEGIGWSDQWSFWQFGYQGIMVTDTAPFRYPDYHRRTDTPEKLDYERMARVVEGLEKVITELVTADGE